MYQGDDGSAQNSYQRAAQTISKSADRDLQLQLKLKQGELSLKKSPTRAAITAMQRLAEQAAGSGLKYASLEGSLAAVEGMIKIKNYADARQSLENLLAAAEKLGARPLLARSHFLMGTLLRLSGNSSEASAEYRQALQIIQEMQKDAGPKFNERSDTRSMLAEANH